MDPLIDEAVAITEELGQVTFVGAVAVLLHTKYNRHSRDLDFAIATEISTEELLDKGYKIFREGGKDVKYTPRDFKIDIFTEDVSNIPIEKVFEFSKELRVKKNTKVIRIASLEVLAVSKHRASRPSRPQDNEDLAEIARTKYNEIQWGTVRVLCESDHEFQQIQTALRLFKSKGSRI